VPPVSSLPLASVDGAIAPGAEATIPVVDEGLLRGDGVFEVVRLYGGRPLALDWHLDRMRRSADGLRLPVDLEAMRAEAEALIAAADPPQDSLLRLVATRGGRRIALVEPFPDRGTTAKVVTVAWSPSRVLDTLKTLSYAANMLATRIAKEQGADEALFVTPHGRVLEGTTWSFFWVHDGHLLTPPLEERILHSITRALVLEECDVEERICTIDDLVTAEEAFIASTVREVMPITAIDGRELPAAPGPVTEAAAAALRARVERELTG
jgi:branched-chain amino acid aminotransferase